MDLSILIVNWNTRDYTAGCLQALAATADRVELKPIGPAVLIYGRYQAEVFVVDNASQDGSVALLRERFPWAQLIENDRNVGFAPANNQAYQCSTGRYVLLLNSDTQVHPQAITALLDHLEAHPRCGAGGAQLLNADGSIQPACQPMLTPWREFWRLIFLDQIWPRATYDMKHWEANTPHRVEVIKGACLIARRAALEPPAPLLDEQYFMYTEEVDLCYRLICAGWELNWIPQAVVTHYGGASSKQAYNTMYVQLYHSKVQFYRKFGGESRVHLFKTLLRIAYWPRWLASSIGARFKPALAERASTFRRLLNELPRM
ncbi:N-acetylglucosaminyl-diphospho-decaprenol L-rhamnosyltransferase [Thermoflexales bacterium]|nr:N-acetylglucosaminyl-diphospho-decaprenol L-rhamnosyltransferase [Thermoflexales bacterium]